MPWDEETTGRWRDEEVAKLRELDAQGLNRAQIADALAEAGFEARDDTSITDKLRRMRR